MEKIEKVEQKYVDIPPKKVTKKEPEIKKSVEEEY